MTTALLLDPSIRDWVLIPIALIVVLVGILRHYVTLLTNSKPKIVMTSVRNQNTSNYGGLLISSGEFLNTQSFTARAKKLISEDLKREVEMENPLDMSDPSVMTGMVKGQLMMLANNFGVMMLVSFFFSGFIVAQFPFSIPIRLKELTQKGIEIDDLECSYATSISFYFVMLYGCSGILQLLLGGDAEVNNMNSMTQMQGQMKQGVDYKKVYKQISEELTFVMGHHKWRVEEAPRQLLRAWKSEKRFKIRNTLKK